MATKNEKDVNPNPQAVQAITLHLTARQREILVEAEEDLAVVASDQLADDPMRAGRLGFVAKFLAGVRITGLSLLAHPPTPAPTVGKRGQRKKAESPGLKVKHVYGANGMCTVDHGDGTCSATRQRAPRAGSAVAASMGDTRTLSIDERLASQQANARPTDEDLDEAAAAQYENGGVE